MNQVPPSAIFLGTLAILAFLMTTAGFVALVWRVSWGVRGFVEAANKRADADAKLVEMLGSFIAVQRETNEQVWTAIQVNADRVNRLVERAATNEQ